MDRIDLSQDGDKWRESVGFLRNSKQFLITQNCYKTDLAKQLYTYMVIILIFKLYPY